jgi:6-phosphogluconolactonase
MKALKARTWISVMLSVAMLLTGCGGGGGSTTPGGGGGGTSVTVPNVVGSSQASATSAITAAGLALGAVSMASSSTVASGNVISESPAAGTSVASGSSVALTVSTGPATVAVPNVVGSTQAAATSTLKAAGLVVGTVTMTTSATVPAGSVISQNPAAGTTVATASAVSLTVSTGPVPGNHFAYVSNYGDGTVSMYSVSPTNGALTALAGSPLVVGNASSQLSEIKIDPSHQFLYVISHGSDQVYAFVINPTTGALTAVAGSPFATGQQPQSMVFDATGAYLYVSNIKDDSVSGFVLNASTGALTQLGAALKLNTGSNPAQLARAGNFLYVTYQNSNTVEVLPINTTNAPGTLSVGTADGTSPYATDLGPYSLAIDPAGTVLYTANAGSGGGSISSFQIDLTTGDLTPFPSGGSLPIPATSDIGIDPQGKFLFVTERNVNGVVDVYPIDAASATGLDAAVAGSPFATGGNAPNSISFDPSGQFAYVGNDQSANVAVFTLASTGVLSPVGSPVAAGTSPDFIAIY